MLENFRTKSGKKIDKKTSEEKQKAYENMLIYDHSPKNLFGRIFIDKKKLEKIRGMRTMKDAEIELSLVKQINTIKKIIEKYGNNYGEDKDLERMEKFYNKYRESLHTKPHSAESKKTLEIDGVIEGHKISMIWTPIENRNEGHVYRKENPNETHCKDIKVFIDGNELSEEDARKIFDEFYGISMMQGKIWETETE